MGKALHSWTVISYPSANCSIPLKSSGDHDNTALIGENSYKKDFTHNVCVGQKIMQEPDEEEATKIHPPLPTLKLQNNLAPKHDFIPRLLRRSNYACRTEQKPQAFN